MRIRTACLDDELLWVIDDVTGGLYSVDQRTFETKCELDYRNLYVQGRFEVQSLLKWKKEYIIIIPRQIDRNWILYNKVTGMIECRKVIKRRCQEILLAVDQDRKQIYFFPLHIHNPILIVDLDTLICSQVIENWSSKAPEGCYETAWRGAWSGQYMFFPIKNTRILVRIDCETRKVESLELDIPENLIDVAYAFGELWALPIKGNRIHQIDENGQIIDTVKLSIGDVSDSIPSFVRIAVQKEYLFLIPCYRKGIYVYNKREKKIYVIPEEIVFSGKEENEIHLRYWEYYVRDNQLCFVPYRDYYIEIDLDTLAYRKKEIMYPAMWSEEEQIQYIIWEYTSEQDFFIREEGICGLKTFLKYIQQCKTDKEDSQKNENTGKMIWNILKD